jgi:ABC-type branched-subunit amino acid transport system ATPase component
MTALATTTTATATAALVVDGVSKSFGGVKAVTGCSFSVGKGEVVGLVGPNGSGKSTTLDLISGFLSTDSGTVFYNGQDVTHLSAPKRARLGLLRTFQKARGWSGLTVMENMLVAAPSRTFDSAWRGVLTPRAQRISEDADRLVAREILNRFGLSARISLLAGSLSGGEARLLEFARAVMAKADTVLLDEPLAGVNPVLITRLDEAIHVLAGEGVSVLVVEHNLPFIEDICDRVVVMAQGAVLDSGSMSEMRANAAVVDAYLGG